MSIRRTFMVEAYAPKTSEHGQLARLADAAADPGEGTSGIRRLRSILVPEDEMCLHLYEADSADALARAVEAVEMRPQRIVEVRVD
jgi:hypothetical protein